MSSLPITAATEFISAETEEAQAKVLETYKAGTVRKGLRHLALKLERLGETEAASQAWALRDALAEKTTTVEFTADDDFTALLAISEEAA